jgi:uncharacterized phage-associated protein
MTFNEEKATAAAAYLLKLRGGKMSYLKLIKLLYLADREAWRRWGFSITTDSYVSMNKGPVVSNIYNLIKEEEREQTFWSRFITPQFGDWEVALRDDIPGNRLSRAEEKLLNEIFAAYGTWDRWKLVEFTHNLPEWKDPDGSSIPIQIIDILAAQAIPPEEIKAILDDLSAADHADRVLGSR